ncbi:XshC-Cox1-family protein [Gemmatirosa kalamazoonensis]|uniref:XshC-Cox1-family protein n=1 Tax=Gemmatirosa kalamazoonensis TaxID=861299 RepID=W0RH23_9BACT|nr:XdhC/CoxI family protein [Gemmatirosa kalamazoonensis]AHG89702.1 XshC-Cox1-family protein [Gemmatirosa kalamazoonensis]
MTAFRTIVDTLGTAATAGETVVLATVVRVVGSSYGGVGSRMVARVDGSTVGLVSGGCLESDLALHARRVHESGRAEVVSYDTRADDDAVWGLGLGCNGLIDVLLEPLAPARAAEVSALLALALAAERPSALATVVKGEGAGAPAVGAHALLAGGVTHSTGEWGDGAVRAALPSHEDAALAAGRRGMVVTSGGVEVAFEIVQPTVKLVVCGSGPDVVPVVRLATELGWDVTVVDHRPVEHARSERFPGARVVQCADPALLADVVPLGARTAAVVMSHHFARDTEYVRALSVTAAGYVGVLGPSARTERMLAELAARGATVAGDRLFGPVGLDLGGDGPEAIALAIVAEAAASMHGRAGGHLRDRVATLHGGVPTRA